jgi:hypothetical protein
MRTSFDGPKAGMFAERNGMAAARDRFLPAPDVRERPAVQVRAPAEFVFTMARQFDLQSVPLVHAIFWLRAKLMRGRSDAARPVTRLDVAGLLRLGWGVLAEESGRLVAAGAVCQPWHADVVFTPLSADRFATYSEPDFVKIAWTLEAEPLGPARTCLATETRASGTDPAARQKFRGYWRWARVGIIAIRWLVLSAIRREAERRWGSGQRAV